MTRFSAVEKARGSLHSRGLASHFKIPPEIKKQVRASIDALRSNANAGTELSGELAGYRSYRIRRYRIIYRFNETESCLEIYHVGQRRDVYETLRLLLLERN